MNPKKVSPGTAAAAEDSAPLTPEALVLQLRAFRQQIPDFDPLPTSDTKRRVPHVGADFVQAAINAIGASTAVRTAVGRAPDDIRLETEEAARWTAVEDELRAILEGVKASNRNRRFRIGLTALQTYGICQQLVRDYAQPDLIPHVQEMKRLMSFGRVRRKRPSEEPETPKTAPSTA